MKIEKGLQIPERNRYPFADMEVGDSIFFPDAGHRSKPAEAAKKYSQRHDVKFSMRQVDDGLRIWRIE